jgi:membrane associated rhomboid family serine protease
METCYRHPDRETALSCSECGRPICTDCMTMAPVGLRCPDHSGRPQGVQKVTTGVRRATYEGTGALLTKALIGVNVAVFALALATGASMDRISGPVLEQGALVIRAISSGGELVGLATGEWWRLITSTFIHAGIFHLGMNMLVLWLVGGPLEQALGRGRFLLLYVVSGLAGSAGALLLSPNAATVGASGAIFGIFGAALVFERLQGMYVLGGSVVGLVVLNLVFTFAFARFGISVGGHLGGMAGGALCALALSRFGRAHAAYGRPGMAGIAGLVAVGLVSIGVAVLQVSRFT